MTSCLVPAPILCVPSAVRPPSPPSTSKYLEPLRLPNPKDLPSAGAPVLCTRTIARNEVTDTLGSCFMLLWGEECLPFRPLLPRHGESTERKNGQGPYSILLRHHNHTRAAIPCGAANTMGAPRGNGMATYFFLPAHDYCLGTPHPLGKKPTSPTLGGTVTSSVG